MVHLLAQDYLEDLSRMALFLFAVATTRKSQFELVHEVPEAIIIVSVNKLCCSIDSRLNSSGAYFPSSSATTYTRLLR